jgi:hypothetical protein
MKKIIILVLLIVVLSGCGLSDKWLGFYYPDGCLSCTEDYIFSPEFNSKDSCLEWAENLQDERGNPNDDFECGKNCEEMGYKMYMCEDTVDY